MFFGVARLGVTFFVLVSFLTAAYAQDSRVQIGDPSALGLDFLGRTEGTSNLATVFNIAAPTTTARTSYNRHDSLDVDADGFIYNNSTTGGVSVLGVNVTANPNLVSLRSHSLPSTIISEVRGASSSMLSGKIEVFGKRADVIIANQHGITCDGCSFINADSVTLTTTSRSGGLGLHLRRTADSGPADSSLRRVTIGSGGLTSDSDINISSAYVDILGNVDISVDESSRSYPNRGFLGFVVKSGDYSGLTWSDTTLTVSDASTISSGHVFMSSLSGSADIGGSVSALTGVLYEVVSGDLTYNDVTSNWFSAESLFGSITQTGNVRSYDVDIYARDVVLPESGQILDTNLPVNPDSSFFSDLYDRSVHVDIVGLDSLTISGVVRGSDVHYSSSNFGADVESNTEVTGGLWLDGYHTRGSVLGSPVLDTLVVDDSPSPIPDILNIARPHAGLSLNRFGQLGADINTSIGPLILNASSVDSTSMGGHAIPKNPFFGSGVSGSDVDLIVLEVTGIDGTFLDGAIELVGGSGSRDVPGTSLVISNPNGVTCNACSFHNFRSSKLTTGRVTVDNSDLLGLSSDFDRSSLVDVSISGGLVSIGSGGFGAPDGSGYLSGRRIEIDGPVVTGDVTSSTSYISAHDAHNLIIEGGGQRISGYSGYVGRGDVYLRPRRVAPVSPPRDPVIDLRRTGSINVLGWSALTITGVESGEDVRLSGDVTGSYLHATNINSGGDIRTGSINAGRVRILASGDVIQDGTVDSHSYRLEADNFLLSSGGLIRVGSTAQLTNDDPDPSYRSVWESDPETRFVLSGEATISGEVTGVGIDITVPRFSRTSPVRDDDGTVVLNGESYANDAVPSTIEPVSIISTVTTGIIDGLTTYWVVTLSRPLSDPTDSTEFDFSYIAPDIPGFTHEITVDPLPPQPSDSPHGRYHVTVTLIIPDDLDPDPTPPPLSSPHIIDIATPSLIGLVSRNDFTSFDVSESGVILNNSLVDGLSSLGVEVSSNPNLTGVRADVILAEVTGGGSQSELHGPLEVFGKPASVIISNPYRIYCASCSFINTLGVTLTTGSPSFDSSTGAFSVSVEQGDITIDNLVSDNSVHLIGHSVRTHSSVTVPTNAARTGYIGLHVGRRTSTFSADTFGSTGSWISEAVIDETTEIGVGTGDRLDEQLTEERFPPAINIGEDSVITGYRFRADNFDDILDIVVNGEVRVGYLGDGADASVAGIDTNGNLEISSTATVESTSGDLTLRSNENIYINGNLTSSDDIRLLSDDSVFVGSTGEVLASGDIHLESDSHNNNNPHPDFSGEDVIIGGLLDAGDDLTFDVFGEILVSSTGRLVSGDDINFESARIIRIAGEVRGGDDVRVSTNAITSTNPQLPLSDNYGDLYILSGGLLRSEGDDIRLDVADSLEIASGGRIEASDDIRGSVRGSGGLTIESGGTLASDDDIRLSVRHALNIEGDDTLTTEEDMGVIRSGDDIRISSDRFEVSGKISSYDKLRLSSRDTLDVRMGGYIGSDTDDVRLSSTNNIMISGEVRAYDDLKFYSRRGGIEVLADGEVEAMHDDLSIRSSGTFRVIGSVRAYDRGSISVRSGNVEVSTDGELMIGGTPRFRIGNATTSFDPSSFSGTVSFGEGISPPPGT